MAIFEKSSNSKIRVDDTERLTCCLENAQNINKHTVSSANNCDSQRKGIHTHYFNYLRWVLGVYFTGPKRS